MLKDLPNWRHETGVIDVKVTAPEQLFSSYSYADDNLNPAFSDYIFDKTKSMLPFKGDLTINIHTDDPTVDTATVTQAWQEHHRALYQERQRERRRLTIIAGFMTLFGLIALTILLLINHFTQNLYLTSMVEIAAWVFIWQAVETFFLQRPLVNAKCRLIARLYAAQINICRSQTK